MNLLCIFAIFTALMFVGTVLMLRLLIPFLQSKKMGQKILDIGPRWHKNKEGTPTMGGISFIIVGCILFVIFLSLFKRILNNKEFLTIVNIYVYAILNGMIGFVDDVAKIRKRKNEGLTPLMKFSLQSIFAAVFLFTMDMSIGLDTTIKIPFTSVSYDLGFAYFILSFLILCGVVNSVNLTDGIDGLASSIVFTVGFFLAAVCILYINTYSLTFISALLIGSSLGFLVYNFYPAKVFMGDTGSLYFGALVAASSFFLNNIILVLIFGFVFICEALSDILQVIFFKFTHGKRLFKMAPLHHHFERKGWSEVKIVTIFTIVNIIFCVIAYMEFIR